ncbi:5'/3'-nucleotidase SurE [Sphingorhabdus lutea]|uniref:5'-nucleotidase SurE n=1 Tax=Sphingorhabdus lutea TaxID=1913578 RepID=A0A1L3JER8_9SPHN|nr:5'/3'-nucleotidase SurE [Sphingorhabdus lutea]APG63622.1 5'/3'-nucleotidase SurE [Sphingorhabdus lutea]
MRIMLTNDDGINAPGLAILEKIAAQLSDDIWVIAPAEENSGAGHSLTLTRPIRIRKHGEKRFSVTGTPTDSVMLGLGKIMEDFRPDLILSGVNRGANLGDDITYSGTVAAAMEGTLAGVRSIALSQVYSKESIGDGVSFDAALRFGADVVKKIITHKFPDRTLVNVNFPPLSPDEVKGVKVVRQGFHDYGRAAIVPGRDPRGFDYYWFGLHGMEHSPDHNTDLEAIDDGYISVTPLQLDLTHNDSLDALSKAFQG